ncbi:AMP-binding protein [Kitasatospora sp. NPDC086791]|uniref:AMP-binding protein n=1 Tax=Kitasatospora sp. NPDC086791 TaxID=3155178 RepID=UPI003438F526
MPLQQRALRHPQEPAIRPSTSALTVLDLLEARARLHPDSVAVTVRDGSAVTYRQWSEQARTAAGGLLAAGVRPGDRVALRFPNRQWDRYAVACLAVHYACATAVPMREDLADAEALALAELCGVGLVLRAEGSAPLPGFDDLTLDRAAAAADPAAPLPTRPAPHDPAQVIGTSGTTGAAKGVLASHANLTSGCSLTPRPRPYAHSKHAVHAFPIGTNAGQMMLIGALTGAPTTVVLPRFDAEEFAETVETLRVGTAFLVPSMAVELLNSGVLARRDLSCLRLLSSSAAALPPTIATALAAALPTTTLVNVYTSAEAVPAQVSTVVDPSRPGSLGRPADPADLRILAEDGTPAAPGQTGEVWLRQPGPARSYIGDAAASAKAFRDGWVRMGDLGSLDADGYLYLADRESDIIKSGALKVSTLRIEDALHEHPQVADAAALGVPHPVMGSAPVAVVVPGAGGVDLDALRVFLARRLSRPEIPLRILLAEDLPRNATGKVVKHRLRPLFDAPAAPAAADRRPGTATELCIATAWKRVINHDVRDVAEEFFAVGGDSFRAVQLAAALSEEFDLPVGAGVIFENPSLRAQAGWIESARTANSAPEAAPAGTETVSPFLASLRAQPHDLPLTAQQENFLRWMAEAPGRDAGSVTALFRVTDDLDAPALAEAVRAVADRHPALRSRFVPAPGEPGTVRLVEDPRARVRTVHTELPGANDADVDAVLITERDRLTDLATDPLTRLLVVSRDRQDHVVLLAVHHMVVDGWSMGVLLHEIALAYSAIRRGRPVRLPEPVLGYRELASWAVDRWPAARTHFGRALADAPASVTPFPGRRAVERVLTRGHPFRIPTAQADGLRRLAAELRATPFMVVAALWTSVLARRSGAEDLVMMTPVPGRTHPEAERVVGCFVQSLLLRVDCAGSPGFAEQVERVRLAATAALDHQLYPFAEFSPAVPFAAWFRYENWAAPAHLPGLACEPRDLPRGSTVPWPMPGGDHGVPELTVVEQPDGGLACWLQFNALAFDPADIAALATDFTDAVAAALH